LGINIYVEIQVCKVVFIQQSIYHNYILEKI